MKNNYIEIDGQLIEVLNGHVYIDRERVQTIDDLEHVVGILIKSVVSIAQR